MKALAEAGAALLGVSLAQVGSLAGGSLSEIAQIRLADGREAIVKNGPSPRMEADMLNAIRATGAPAPAVLAVDDEVLVIEFVRGEGSLSGAWADLGACLTKLHRAYAERYGWAKDYAFGPLPIANGWSDDWPAFWGERRLLVHLPHIPANLGRRIEMLAADLPNRLPRRPQPSLLHGDLWAGNILVRGARVSGLIDPACYYGHSEVDLAMLSLFDRPSATFHDTYAPPEPGLGERAPIYGLWPALVHLRLFGAGYRSMVERQLSAAGV